MTSANFPSTGDAREQGIEGGRSEQEEERAEGKDIEEAGSETKFTILGMNEPGGVMDGPRMIETKVGWASTDPLLVGAVSSLTGSRRWFPLGPAMLLIIRLSGMKEM